MANSRKKISELPALSVASLDTTFVLGISGSTTYKISINNLTSSLDTTFATDLVTNALSNTLNSKLSTSSFNSYTASVTTSVNINTGSLVTTSSFNSYTASISTASLVTSISNLNTFTASQSTSSLVNRLNAIESVSGSWITESETGSFLTSLNGAISSSSQLTSSYDTRYTLSGSVQPLPSNLLSSSAQITAFGFISSSQTIDSGSLVTTSSFNSYTASISTASLVTSISNLNTFTASVSTASLVTSITNLNSFTASENTKASTLASYTASVNTTTSSLNAFTSSINSWTSSFSSSLASSITSVSGTFTNLTVNGQPITYGVVNPDFINAGRITSDQTGLGANSDIIFNAWVYKNGVSLDTTTGVFTLTAGKTYRLFAELSFSIFSSVVGYMIYNWVDATTNTRLDTSGISSGIGEAINRDTNEFNATSTTLIYTPTTNQTVKVRITEAVGTATVRSAIGTKAIIEQLNPTITLNALDTMQISGSLTTTGSITSLGGITGSIASTNGVISGSSQLTSSFDTRYLNTGGDGVISGSAQLPSGLISGSTQLTTSFPSKTTGAWSVPAGASTQSFTVESGHSYSMWVNGNIPNGIITWNATVTTANTNVPAVGSQYGWYYTPGNALVLTTIPDQIIGTNGSIANIPTSYAPNTSNVFKFGITNNTVATQTINYGYIKLS